MLSELREVYISEATASKRRVYFYLEGVSGDEALGITGQPQISVNGASWTDTGIGTITEVGNGEYYADLTVGIVGTADQVIRTRFKDAALTKEARGTTVKVIPLAVPLVSTVTNLTNAPTVGDLTAAMIASVTAAATAATPIAASVAGNVTGNLLGTLAVGERAAIAAAVAALFPLVRNSTGNHVSFYMRDSGNPLIGKTGVPTVVRSLNGAAFTAVTGTVTETGSGVVDFSPSAADCNAASVVYLATLSGAISDVFKGFTHA